LLNEPPRELLKSKYGFDLTDAWLEHARLASIRFNNGVRQLWRQMADN
jgi:hypothetical protein